MGDVVEEGVHAQVHGAHPGQARAGEQRLDAGVVGERAAPAAGAGVQQLRRQVRREQLVHLPPQRVHRAEGGDAEPAAGREQARPRTGGRCRVGQEEQHQRGGHQVVRAGRQVGPGGVAEADPHLRQVRAVGLQQRDHARGEVEGATPLVALMRATVAPPARRRKGQALPRSRSPSASTLGDRGTAPAVASLTRLHAVLSALPALAPERRGEALPDRVVLDSRQVRPGDLYAAVPGARTDGHEHAAQAVQRGAVALLVSRWLDLPVPQLRVRRVRAALGLVAAELEGRPADGLRLVAVTGTNGKTTTSLLLHAALLRAGGTPGLIGTLGSRLGTTSRASALTTPEAPELHALLRWASEGGARDVVLEASSIALDQGRLDGLRVELAVHTGLEEEHLDFHGTVEQYWAAKAALFAPGRCATALVRVDDAWGVRLARQVQVPVTTFGGGGSGADVRLERVRTGLSGTGVDLVGADGRVRLEVPLLGRVNGVNATAAYLAARALGLSREQARDGLADAVAPPGRHSLVLADEAPLVVVDFAHTPAALAALLDTGRELAAPGGRVLLVFGGRGERDRAKRADLARVGAGADLLVLTCDTVERERPDAVLAEYRLGLLGLEAAVVVEPDRRAALALALRAGRPGDVVLVAGRGAEQQLTVGSRSERFVDREVVLDLLARRGPYGAAA